MNDDQYIRIFTGTEIDAGRLKEKLENLDITPIIKNEGESGRLAGFAPPVFNQVRVYVHKDEHSKAIPVLEELEKEINDND
ncbi:putative signal transducing protein [Robertkochia aurantiaca]|uniref:putative signal transducing protein n=1 Tax=Robertkochia aurantiaca TaxID=2873700 RepID=UPI001CC97A22|nr:DUF2007 domain-containing protein [Robertkochia sp. 3YJGBD-33]